MPPTFLPLPPARAALTSTSAARSAFLAPPPEKCSARERWADNVFVHYALEPAEVQAALPSGLLVDTYPDAQGTMKAWVTVWLFRQEKSRFAWIPELLGATFPDLHVHSPVLDAAGARFSSYCFRIWLDNRFAAAVGRRFYGAPIRRVAQRIACDSAGRGSFRSDAGSDHRVRATWQVGPPVPRVVDWHTRDAFLHDRFELVMGRTGAGSRVRHTAPQIALHEVRLDDWECRLEGLPFALPERPSYATYGGPLEVEIYAHQAL